MRTISRINGRSVVLSWNVGATLEVWRRILRHGGARAVRDRSVKDTLGEFHARSVKLAIFDVVRGVWCNPTYDACG